MVSAGLELMGLSLCVIGTLLVMVSCGLPMWKVTAFIEANIVVAQTIWDGLWMSCVVQSTGQMQCKVHDSYVKARVVNAGGVVSSSASVRAGAPLLDGQQHHIGLLQPAGGPVQEEGDRRRDLHRLGGHGAAADRGVAAVLLLSVQRQLRILGEIRADQESHAERGVRQEELRVALVARARRRVKLDLQLFEEKKTVLFTCSFFLNIF
uniref:Claudin n=1 Tax=Gasterosteus aculeatus aculeatus TaxID=481459 RepID=G3NPU4_GASAC